LRRIVLIALGLLLAVTGIVLMILPVPVPMIGLAPFAIGCIVLSANSRTARRWIQGARHRFAPLSHVLERFTARAPHGWARILRRTRPDAIVRRIKIAARKAVKV
jgi:hypothetical protein